MNRSSDGTMLTASTLRLTCGRVGGAFTFGQLCTVTVMPRPYATLTFPLLLYLLLLFVHRRSQQREDDTRLRVHSDGCHQHLTTAFHHVRSCTSTQFKYRFFQQLKSSQHLFLSQRFFAYSFVRNKSLQRFRLTPYFLPYYSFLVSNSMKP